MVARVLVLCMTMLAVGAWGGTTPAKHRARGKLDHMTDAVLDRDLQAKLNDVLRAQNPNVPLSISVLHREIMEALHDEDPADDPFKAEISFADIEEEMEEDGESVEHVVNCVLLRLNGETCAAEHENLRLIAFVPGGGGMQATPAQAVRAAKTTLKAEVHKVVR